MWALDRKRVRGRRREQLNSGEGGARWFTFGANAVSQNGLSGLRRAEINSKGHSVIREERSKGKRRRARGLTWTTYRMRDSARGWKSNDQLRDGGATRSKSPRSRRCLRRLLSKAPRGHDFLSVAIGITGDIFACVSWGNGYFNPALRRLRKVISGCEKRSKVRNVSINVIQVIRGAPNNRRRKLPNVLIILGGWTPEVSESWKPVSKVGQSW